MKKINLKKFNMLVESKLGDIKPMLNEEWPPEWLKKLAASLTSNLDEIEKMAEVMHAIYKDCGRENENFLLSMTPFEDFGDECPSCVDFHFELLRGNTTINQNSDIQNDCLSELAVFLGEDPDGDITNASDFFICMNKGIIEIEDFKK